MSISHIDAKLHAEEMLALKAIHVLDDAYAAAQTAANSCMSIENFLRTDYRVLDAVLFLTAVGKDYRAVLTADVAHRLSAVEWEALRSHAIGVNLRPGVQTAEDR